MTRRKYQISVYEDGESNTLRISEALRAAGIDVAQVSWTLGMDEDHTITGRDHPATSRSAAALAFPRSGTQRRAVYERIRTATTGWQGISGARYFGITDPQIAEQLGITSNSERPRRVELVAGGWVRDSGKTYRVHGRDHTLWVATDRLPVEPSDPTVPVEAAQGSTGAPSGAVIGSW